jgi:hypothetical protein
MNTLWKGIRNEIKCDSLRATDIYGNIHGPTSNNIPAGITGATGYFGYFNSITGQINNFYSYTGDIDTLYSNTIYAATGEIGTLYSNTIYATTGDIGTLISDRIVSPTGDIGTLISDRIVSPTGDIGTLNVTNKIVAPTGEIGTLNVTNKIVAPTGEIGTLNVTNKIVAPTGEFDTIKCNTIYVATGIYGKDITATGNISTSAQGSFGNMTVAGNITSASFYLINIFNSNSFNTTDYTLSFGYGASSAGQKNTAFGSNALKGNVTSNSNTAFGYQALFNLKNGNGGYNNGGNTAIGTGALIFCSPTGESNTAVGWQSSQTAKGSNNTAIGAFSNAGYYGSNSSETYGSNNTCIGYSARVSTDQASNEVVLGDSNVSVLRCAKQTISGLSDKRDKTNITNLKSCLNFINELKPVTFNWDKREWYNTGVSDGSKKEEKIIPGFIAQDLKEVQEKHNMEYLDLVYESNPEKLEATPGNLLTPLIKAVQELTALVNTQQKEIEELKLNK